ncbi:DUF983 domain-containing protein [Roseomonas marmotae]|uniref:DUF983 domain-containing protein n=1 Tax=Roseomonas marmotae TaxID=2768161 RepID=A0ABS3KH12_9PROT|nr:DUF983 domain-containing protein [Roseomonas marmotae]MBO1076707.1 DUF983 domain-containing protein [Roseomonas marmotae]QTI79832.1 DUF983 domain-containing protein [Roseomonas marmotae]
MAEDTEHRLPPGETPFSLGIRGRCPRCGQGHIFAGFLRLAKRCEVCGLDMSFADPADGPAFFVMSIVAVPVTIFAIWLELGYEPPFWVHLLTTFPLLIVSSMLLLRPFKGWLVCSQYINKAEEGRFGTRTPEA